MTTYSEQGCPFRYDKTCPDPDHRDHPGRRQEWRDAADKLVEALARDNQYIVGDVLQVFLESAGYGLTDYAPLGGVFRRAAARGIIKRIDRPARQALWVSNIYVRCNHV